MISVGFVNATGRLYEDTATFHCDVGYRLQGSASAKCLYDGNWSGKPPGCKIISCSKPSLISNGTALYTETSLNSVVKYVCSVGFKISYNSTRQCQSDGTWSGTTPHCDAISCTKPKSVEYGLIDYSCHHFTCQVHYKCIQGYSLLGNSTLRCNSDGNWDASLPICNEVVCDPLPREINNGLIDFTSLAYLSKAEIRCNTGYLSSYNEMLCEEDGNWSCNDMTSCGNITCIPVECPRPVIPSNSFISVPSHLTYGSEVLYRCDYGYRLIGDVQKICLSNSTWSGSYDPYCEFISCPELKLSDDLVELSYENASRPVDLRVVFSCPEAYILRGDSVAFCTEDSTWNYTDPSCHRIQCEKPDPIEDGAVKYGNRYLGDVVSYSCNVG